MKFQITIRDVENDEIVLDRKCDCILGAIVGNETNSMISAGIMSYTRGTIAMNINAIDLAEEAADRLKKLICEDLKRNCEAEISYEELSNFVKKVYAQVSVDEDAIKEMAEMPEVPYV